MTSKNKTKQNKNLYPKFLHQIIYSVHNTILENKIEQGEKAYP